MNEIIKGVPPELRAFINNRRKYAKVQLFNDVMIEEVGRILCPKGMSSKFICESRINTENWQFKRMLLDMVTYLPDEILAKVDRASMKYSLETRCPLLDYRFIEKSLCIDHSLKYHHFEKKYILKQLTYQYVPKQLLDRPKHGFGVPLQKWLRTFLADDIAKFSNKDALDRQAIFNSEAIHNLILKQSKSNKIVYSSILWSFYVFQRWYQQFIEDCWA